MVKQISVNSTDDAAADQINIPLIFLLVYNHWQGICILLLLVFIKVLKVGKRNIVYLDKESCMV
jgi:hypothetical protein